jgi:hypothetical protein
VTIDADVASEIERIRKAEGKGFKLVLNDLLRDGLKHRAGRPTTNEWKSPIQPFDVGPLLIDISSTSRAIDISEGEDHR